jgi:hypothetical protein
MSTEKQFFAELLHQKNPLLDTIIEYNRLLPSRIAHHAATPEARPFLLCAPSLANRAGARGPLAAFGRAGAYPGLFSPAIQTRWFCDFRVPRHRLALLPPEALDRLAALFGLVQYRREIAMIINREKALALREALGEDAYDFALKRATLLPQDANSAAEPQTSPLERRIYISGRKALARVLGDAPAELLARLRLTMSPDFLADFDSLPPNSGTAETAWRLLHILVCKEIAPSWHKYFI